jgi:hypothetical protein
MSLLFPTRTDGFTQTKIVLTADDAPHVPNTVGADGERESVIVPMMEGLALSMTDGRAIDGSGFAYSEARVCFAAAHSLGRCMALSSPHHLQKSRPGAVAAVNGR